MLTIKNTILTMKKTIGLLAAIMLSQPVMAFDLENLLSEAEKKTSDAFEGVSTNAVENPLTGLLTKGLGVNDKQAAGGAGAMLAMAYQSLDEKQSGELLNMVPGMDNLTSMIPANLGGNIKDLTSLSQIFNLLGLNSSMVQKYTPVVLKYLGEKGASESLLGNLSKLWGK